MIVNRRYHVRGEGDKLKSRLMARTSRYRGKEISSPDKRNPNFQLVGHVATCRMSIYSAYGATVIQVLYQNGLELGVAGTPKAHDRAKSELEDALGVKLRRGSLKG